jgi:DNA polymerase III alpha subunit
MDVDIDFANRGDALPLFKHVVASRKTDTGMVAHNSGVYFQPIPSNPITNLSNIDYKEAEKRGYFKIDFLNVNVYKDIESEEHLVRLMNQEPVWELLESDEFVNMLFQLNGHGDLLRTMKPRNIDQLAAVIALIRPGKKHLIGQSWDAIMKEIWTKTANAEYEFKRSHSYAYAMVVIVQMNQLCEKFTS